MEDKDSKCEYDDSFSRLLIRYVKFVKRKYIKNVFDCLKIKYSQHNYIDCYITIYVFLNFFFYFLLSNYTFPRDRKKCNLLK